MTWGINFKNREREREGGGRWFWVGCLWSTRCIERALLSPRQRGVEGMHVREANHSGIETEWTKGDALSSLWEDVASLDPKGGVRGEAFRFDDPLK